MHVLKMQAAMYHEDVKTLPKTSQSVAMMELMELMELMMMMMMMMMRRVMISDKPIPFFHYQFSFLPLLGQVSLKYAPLQ